MAKKKIVLCRAFREGVSRFVVEFLSLFFMELLVHFVS